MNSQLSRRLRLWGSLLIAGFCAFSPVGALAQPPPLSCEDQLRTVRVYADTLSNVRQRIELDAAQTIATLLKRIEQLQAEVTALKGTKKE